MNYEDIEQAYCKMNTLIKTTEDVELKKVHKTAYEVLEHEIPRKLWRGIRWR